MNTIQFNPNDWTTVEELPPLFKPGNPLYHLRDLLEVELKTELSKCGYNPMTRKGRKFPGEIYKQCLLKATEKVLKSQALDTVSGRHSGAYSQLRFAIRSELAKEIWRRRKERDAKAKLPRKKYKAKPKAYWIEQVVQACKKEELRIKPIQGRQDEITLPNGYMRVSIPKKTRMQRPKWPSPTEPTLVMEGITEDTDNYDSDDGFSSLPPFIPYNSARERENTRRHFQAVEEEERQARTKVKRTY